MESAIPASPADDEALADARAARDAFAQHVQELERALSQERLRVREAEEELRRLHSTASVDAHAVATGRAEPEPIAVAAPPAVAPPPPPMPPARGGGPAPAAAAAAGEPEPQQPGKRPKVERRSAMAEFAGLASLDPSEGRRRR